MRFFVVQAYLYQEGPITTLHHAANQAIEDLATRAKELALADHRLLIEQLGVPQHAAAEAAEKSW